MEITVTLEPHERSAWRRWLEQNHAHATEIWLIYQQRGEGAITYLDIVEEALCFGWVDWLAKKYDATRTAQRLTPRRARSHWTELNKERARRLIREGLMTPAGLRIAPDLAIEAFAIPGEVRAALEADPGVWRNFQAFPALYQRVRVGYVAEALKSPAEYERRLRNLVERTRKNEMFGNWDDAGLARTARTVTDPTASRAGSSQ